MNLKELNEKIDILDTSPIRQYLKNTNKISLFEDEKIELKDIDKIININKENLHNPLKIVVLGEVKAGKSTLVNALIGKKVSYTNVVEATANILEIKYSKEEKIIIKQKNEELINLHSLDELDELMNDNRNNQEFFNKINKISVFTNTERLKQITLVDTPGFNTVTSENAERTEDYIANADVVLWILNSHHLGQSDISEKIEEILDYGKPIICVLNRIDEINGDTCELVEYVQNEMGYMFSEVFATSAKKAWDGYIEKNSFKINESNITELYEYIVNNIERNAEQVQKESILESMKVQIKRDLYVHKNIKLKIDGMIKSFEDDLRELNQFNNTIKQIISNKISEWIDTKFFEEEKQLITNCGNNEGFVNLIKKYSSDEYIHNLINYKYEELNNYILDEWTNNTEQFMNKQNQCELEMISIVNPYSIIETETTHNSTNVIEGVKQGGLTAGAVGLGLAGYAAWLGPAAAYVSIGSAVSAFFPPLLIAGAIGGAVWKLVGTDKNKVNRYNQVDALVFEIKSNIKNKVISNMKNNLYQASDHYYNNCELMIMSILQQCNTSKEETKKISDELDKYLSAVGVNISNEINNNLKMIKAEHRDNTSTGYVNIDCNGQSACGLVDENESICEDNEFTYFSKFNVQTYLDAFLNEEEIKKLVDVKYTELSEKIGFSVGLSESSSVEAITIMVLIEILKSHKKLEEARVLEGAIELLYIGLIKPAECSDYYSEILSYYNIMDEDVWSDAYRYVKENFQWVKTHCIYKPNYVYERIIFAKCERNENSYNEFLNTWKNDISYIETNFGDNIKAFDIHWIEGKKIISGTYTLTELYGKYFSIIREYINQKYS